MSNKDDGGPAFPNSVQPDFQWAETGMSLRDWFAGQALASLGTWTPHSGGSNLASRSAMEARALWAYKQADAMVAASQQGGDQ